MNGTANTIKRIMGVQDALGRKTQWEEKIEQYVDQDRRNNCERCLKK